MSPKPEDALSLERMATEVETVPRHSAYSRISNNTTRRFYRLPSEILLLIHDELSDSSTLALRLVCSGFIYLYEDTTRAKVEKH